MTEIYFYSGSDAFCKALNNWNDNRDYQKWKDEYFTKKQFTHQSVSIMNDKWQKTTFITVAPTIFVDDDIFRHTLSDLEFLLKEKASLPDI